MMHFDNPTLVFDFRDRANCERVARTKPGESVSVLVRPDDDENSKALLATGRRSDDGQRFQIEAVIQGRTQEHAWTWATLRDAVRIHAGATGVR